jgi:hypothetical protein
MKSALNLEFNSMYAYMALTSMLGAKYPFKNQFYIKIFLWKK